MPCRVDEFDRSPLLSVRGVFNCLKRHLNHFQPPARTGFFGTNTVNSVVLEEF